MADFVNQVLMQQRRAGGDPQGEAIARNSAALGQTLMQQAQMRMNQQQSDAAMRQREMNEGLTVLGLDWVPTEDKVRVANKLGQQFGLQGSITADGLNPYRQLLTDMKKDVDDGKDLSRWSSAVELFSANPQFVEPQLRPSVLHAQQQIQEQKVQNVAGQQFPSVEGGPEAMSRTQEARGRLALFNAITPDDPDAAQKLEAFTKVYGSAERLQQQIEADRLIVQDEEERIRKRDQYAAALRMAPAELAKQTAAAIDPKTMMLPSVSRALKEYGVGNLPEDKQRELEAYLIMSGQIDKLEILVGKTSGSERRQYQQDLDEVNVQTGMIDDVVKAAQMGAEKLAPYVQGTQESLAMLRDKRKALGSTPKTEDLKRFLAEKEAIKTQLTQATEAVAKDWEETVAPLREELSRKKAEAMANVQELNKRMFKPGVDRVTVGKRMDFYHQLADTYDLMNTSLGTTSELDLALKKNEIEDIKIQSEYGTDDDKRAATGLLKTKQEELRVLERQAEKHVFQMDTAKKRLASMGRITQAKITAADKTLDQKQQNGKLASLFLQEVPPAQWGTMASGWFTKNSHLVKDADVKIFLDTVKPAIESRKQIQNERAVLRVMEELPSGAMETTGGRKKFAQIMREEGADPNYVQDAVKDRNKPMVEVNMAGKASEEAAKDFTKSTRATYDQLKSAPILLRNIDEAKALIPQAKGFMGPGGEGLLEAAKFLNARIGAKINTEGIKSAEELRTRIFFNIMENLKKMDAQPSEMQQIMMRDALGKLGTDPNALSSVLDAYGDTIRDKVELFNREVAGAEKKGTQFPYDPRIILPLKTSPEGYPMMRDDADFDKIRSGEVFIDPKGKKRKKP